MLPIIWAVMALIGHVAGPPVAEASAKLPIQTIQESLQPKKPVKADFDKDIAPLKAKQAEAAQAAQKAREEQERVASQPVVQTPVQRPTAAPSGTCVDWMRQAGISDIATAAILIARESGCNPYADNPSSSAYGIPQALPGSKMASAGADWATNPVTQLRWMESYVMGRYKSWTNALDHSNRLGWY